MPTEEECIEEEHLPEEEEVIGDILPTEEKAEFFYYVRWIDNHLGLAPRSYLVSKLYEKPILIIFRPNRLSWQR